jgi:hypothetical protein
LLHLFPFLSSQYSPFDFILTPKKNGLIDTPGKVRSEEATPGINKATQNMLLPSRIINTVAAV